MRQHIVVTEYSPEWAAEFERESEMIKNILKDNCVAIHHIGSTAVAGLKAKPIIDMMPDRRGPSESRCAGIGI